VLTLTDAEWPDWELNFLDHMKAIDDELSTRQAEKLVELRDDAVEYTKIEGFRFKTLIDKCWLSRHDLSSDHDVEFIERLKETVAASLRKRDAKHLMRCCRELGEIEPHQGWTFIPLALKAA
jgi:hypothetical protein